MSFAVDAQGHPLVLDQVNGRVVRFGPGGEVLGSIPLTQRAPQDIAVGNGAIAVLDRLGDKNVTLYRPDGTQIGVLPLAGEGIEATGLVTGLFVDGDDVYVEREHGPLVLVGSTSGDAKRAEIPGRPTRDGLSYINAGLIDAASGRIYVSSVVRKTGDPRFTRELRLNMPVTSIVLLDTDKTGTIYVASVVEPAAQAESVHLLCLDPLTGAPTGAVDMPPNTSPDETFRDLVVLDDGGVVYSMRADAGVTYRHYDCY